MSTGNNDYYSALGVGKNATPEELKSAYRKQAVRWHPDKHAADKKVAEAKFKEINEAYQVLSDPNKKAAYDRYGHAAFEAGGMGNAQQHSGFGQQGQSGGQGPFNYTYYTSGGQNGFDFDFGGFTDPFEIFEQFFGGASPFGGRRSQRRRKTYSMEISFMEAVSGTEKEVDIEGKKTTIKIPKGVDSDSRIRFADFDLVVSVKPDSRFKREGDDLIVEQKINYSTAIMGGVVEVLTIDGKEKIKIHSGTQPGTLIRLREKGVPNVRGNGRGDMYVKITIFVPDKITNRQKELLSEFENPKNEKMGWF